MMHRMNGQDYLDYLHDRQLVDERALGTIKKYMINNAKQPGLPFYFHLLAGVGTLISTFCLYSVLNLFGFISFFNTEGFLGWGISFIVLAILIYFQFKSNKSLVQQSFLIQFSFALMVVGKVFIIIYTLYNLQNYFKFHSTWVYSAILFLLTGLTFFLYKVTAERFLGCFFLFLSIIYNITETPFFQPDNNLVLNIYMLLQVVLASVLFTHSFVKNAFITIAYALVLSVAVEIVFFDLTIAPWILGRDFGLIYVQYGFALLLIWSMFWASGAPNIRACFKNIHLILASLLVVLLSYLTAPGIIFSIFLIVLGYACQRRFLWLLGVFLMPIYLFFYYYDLQVTLLEKSIIMFSSGLILLIGAAYIRICKLDIANSHWKDTSSRLAHVDKNTLHLLFLVYFSSLSTII
ncbi:MAG: DUF4401 domain-containing protein [Alphaproteobacteria bacterium]|nr:DUF4401 domain-containing protein [Alphaproteobacteria bacterium]